VTEPLLEATGLVKSFAVGRNLLGRPTGRVDAVRSVDLRLERGETLALVGESGAGKSTLGRLVLRLIEPDRGSVRLDGIDLLALRRRELRAARKRMQMIFQDPFSSLDPKMIIEDAVGEPLAVHFGLRGVERRRRVLGLLDRVGIGEAQAERYPHEFSGGQLQRIAIARALAVEPDLIVCDEPVAALDVSIRAQVINLLRDIQRERGVALIFVTHDLSLVRVIAHRVAVMYQGRVVEEGAPDVLFESPRHPYTRSLLEVIPVPDPRHTVRHAVQFTRQRPDHSGSTTNGCAYGPRCPEAMDVCWAEGPDLRVIGAGRVSCHLAREENGLPAPRVPESSTGRDSAYLRAE
jgi:oligopeptide transport system ATP-binding protein